MANSSEILLEYPEPGFAHLLLNRTEKRNALSIDMMKLMCAALEQLRERKDLRVLILYGAGPLFCTGMDLTEAADEDKSDIMAELMCQIFLGISQAPYVTIAAIQGAAIAGGAGLVLAADFVVAAEGTNIGFPEVQRGLVPAQVAVLLRRRLGGRGLREMLLLGAPISCKRALEMGLVDRVVAPNDLRIKTSELAQQIVEGAPHAIAMTKQLLAQLPERPLEEDLDMAITMHQQARASGEAKEGIQSFLEGRKPSWANFC